VDSRDGHQKAGPTSSASAGTSTERTSTVSTSTPTATMSPISDAEKYERSIPFLYLYRREMPVTIAVFINPGRTPEQKEATDSEWGDRTNNRGMEYNALDDKYARLIIDELLPELKKTYKISDDPNDRAIAGASSGAICRGVRPADR